MPSRRSRSQRQEHRIAGELGGQVTPGSGSGWVTKNDVKTQDVSYEIKYTDKKSYSLRRDDLLKAERQALLDGGREFAFIVGFGNRVGQSAMRIDREFVVISREHYESLRSRGNPE